MKKQLLSISLLIAASTTVAQNYSGGSGTVADPYQIANKADLKMLSDSSSHWAYNFIQTADIMFTSADFASTGDFYYGGNGFNPIGKTASFSGSYDGNNHIIDSLSIVNASIGGLFASTANTATVSNLGCTNINISGTDQLAGLISANSGTIKNCYTSGTVTGSQDFIGGLVTFNSGIIINCYSSSSVSGNLAVGGLAGQNDGTINNSYNIGSVNGAGYVGGLVGYNSSGYIFTSYSSCLVTGSSYVGGLIGSDATGTNQNNFWNTDMYASDNSLNGSTGLSTAQMQTISTFTNATWDFVGESANGTADIWTMGACNSDGSSYPILAWQVFPAGGEGTTTNPFVIATKTDLKTLSENACLWNKNFVQIADITFSATDFASGGAFYNAGQGFSPIGDNTTNFTGSYDGGGHFIDELFINRPTQDNIGLFGATNGASIHELGLTNCHVSGQILVGGLVGSSSTSINNCFVSGTVNGSTYVGGMVGHQFNLTMSDCYAMGTVHGDDGVGGIAGYNHGTINNCYFASGNVSATGTGDVGGLVAVDFSGVINNSFWEANTCAINNGIGTSKTTVEMKTPATYTSAGWDFSTPIWQMNCTTNNGYPILYWQTLNTAPTISGSTTSINVSCNAGSNGSIDLTPSGGTSPYTFAWSNSATTEDLAGLAAGSYSVVIMDSNICTGTQSITITEPAALDNTTSTSNETITANANGLSYQWIDCNNGNTAIAGETNQSYTATANGNYAVVITSGACSDTSACVAINSVGIKNVSVRGSVKIYPNPSSGLFVVEGFENGTNFEIVNVIGQVVYSQKTNEAKTIIDLSNQANGVYFIKTTNGYSHKLIKQD